MRKVTAKLQPSAEYVKSEDAKPKLPGEFVICPNDVLDSNLTAPELRLWLFIAGHCVAERINCHPSVERLSAFMRLKERRVFDLLRSLERKGFLTWEHRHRTTARLTPKHPGVLLPIVVAEEDLSAENCSQKPETAENCTFDCNKLQIRVHKNAPETDVLKQSTESDYVASSSKPNARPKTKVGGKKSKKPLKDPGELQALLHEIDLEPFREKWEPKGVNVAEVWERFREVTLNGNAKKPEPNPYNYKSLSMGFGTWCELEAKKAKTQQPQEPQSNLPAYRKINRSAH